MKLYTYDPAPNPRRLNLFLSFKGIQIPSQQIDLAQKAALSPEYLARNPRGIVPALELDDGTLLCDALAIALYLEDLYPQPALFGSDALERARIVSWDQYIISDGFMPVAEVLRNGNPAFADRPLPGSLLLPQIPSLVDRGRLRIPVFFDALESALKDREFLVGTGLSWADICAFCVIDFGRWVKAAPPEHCTRLLAWYERIKLALVKA